MTANIVGIDLGTTNSEIALYVDGRPQVLGDEQGRLILPSVVGLVGNRQALGQRSGPQPVLAASGSDVRSIKRRMGSDARVRLGEREYTPQEISAIILARLKEIAERQLNHPVRKAVITVPAYFSDAQRQATREAGEVAGLEVPTSSTSRPRRRWSTKQHSTRANGSWSMTWAAAFSMCRSCASRKAWWK